MADHFVSCPKRRPNKRKTGRGNIGVAARAVANPLSIVRRMNAHRKTGRATAGQLVPAAKGPTWRARRSDRRRT